MFLAFEHRTSESPFVERIWKAHSERAGKFLSIAAGHCELVITRLHGHACLTLRGPETRMTTLDCPAEGEWVGIRLKLGTFLQHFPPLLLRDHRDVTLAGATRRSFWLNGSACEYPTFDNAEGLVSRLVRSGNLTQDATIGQVLRGVQQGLSERSTQRHFVQATGITYAAFRGIERARYATNLLLKGVPIIDVVDQAGYFDQPHLTRSLKYRIGQTPAEIARQTRQLSFLYETTLLR
jgi:AraC-like DNA-binding protein